MEVEAPAACTLIGNPSLRPNDDITSAILLTLVLLDRTASRTALGSSISPEHRAFLATLRDYCTVLWLCQVFFYFFSCFLQKPMLTHYRHVITPSLI